MNEPERPEGDQQNDQPAPPYGQQPYSSTSQPPQPPAYGGPQPQQPQSPYAGAPSPHYASAGQPPQPQPPYPVQPPYPAYPAAAQPPQKKKVWPWALCGCLLAFVLGIGGCVGCVACGALYFDRSYNDSFDPRYDGPGYGYNHSYENGNPDDYGTSRYEGLTLEDIEKAVGDLPSTVEDGRCTAGVYQIGPGKDIEPGLYFLEGSSDAEGTYYVFDRDDDTGTYSLELAVSYFGNYFAQLEAGDAIAFLPGKDELRMYPSKAASFAPAAPYENGLYRVGVDIPAGTYTVTVSADASASASQDSAAFVMKDLDFDSDSITQTKYVIAGGSQTVTVTDGDYLELYAAVATPAE